jgi:hypothetical protein
VGAGLAGNGADLVAPFSRRRAYQRYGRTPAEEALVNGHRELAAMLGAWTGSTPHLPPAEAFASR